MFFFLFLSARCKEFRCQCYLLKRRARKRERKKGK